MRADKIMAIPSPPNVNPKQNHAVTPRNYVEETVKI